jgi:outer membrane receptor for ferrienterochelin and colicin
MKASLILSLMFLFLLPDLYSQKIISGKVIEKQSNKAVTEIIIKIKDHNYKTTTNILGQFQFTIPDSISDIEFETDKEWTIVDIKPYKNNTYKIYVETISTESLLELTLDDILDMPVVTASKYEEKVSNIPASVELITRKQIKDLGFLNLQEVLSYVTGFYLWDDYHVRGAINIGLRGSMSSDNIIILVNGVNQIESVYNEYLLPKIGVPVNTIDRIEIIKGPMSVQYGSGAFFGVINIITNENKEEQNSEFVTTYGSNNTLQSAINFKKSENNFSLSATASVYTTDGVDVDYSQMMTNPDALSAYGLDSNASTKGILLDKRAYFNLSTQYKNLQIDFTHTFVERGGFLVQPPVSYSPMDRNSSNVMISYKKEFSNLFWCQLKTSFLSTNSMATYFLNEPQSFLTFGYNSNAFEAELISYFKPSDQIELSGGLYNQSVFYATNPAELEAAWGVSFGHHLTRLTINSSINVYAAYLQMNYSPVKQIHIVAGARFEEMGQFKMESSGGALLLSHGREFYESVYDNNKLYFIPRIAFIYNWDEGKQTIKIIHSQALRHPPIGKMTDMLFYTSESSEFNLPKLVAATIHTTEINYTGAWSGKVYTSFSLFQNQLHNLISQYIFTDPADSSSLYFTGNVGEIQNIGVEAKLDFNYFEKLKLTLSAIYQKSKNLESGYEKIDIAYSPPLLAYAKINYQIIKQINLAVYANFVDKMLPEYNKLNDTRIGLKVPAYYLLNSNIKLINFPLNSINIDFHCTNILNTEIHYPTTTLNTFADKGLVAPGRMFYASVSYSF